MNTKVIAFNFGERGIRTPDRGVLQYPDHYQNISGPEDAMRELSKIIAFERENDPGVPMDLIIVNNDVGYTAGNEYIDSLNDSKTPWGIIRTFTRPNIGWSFGAFNHAYKKFRNDYQYWLFTEDDILVGSDKYYAKLIDKFNQKEDTGFVSLVGVMKHSYGIHAGGGVGLSHKKILDKVIDWKGQLAHHSAPDDKNDDLLHRREKIIRNGEVDMTNEILLLGYDLVNYSEQKEWDLNKNLCIPFFNYENNI